jgi:hypothetical protein
MNALTFTLGLEVQNFLQGLGISAGKILSFSAVMEGVRAVASRMWEQIERGGGLADLSNRTGESVGTLYQLQEAFKDCGLSADAVSPMIMKMQKALSGMDEMGVKTDGVFEKLGLSMAELKGMSATQQMEAMAAALAKLPKEEAVTLAGKLVGREGAGDLMQLTRDLEGFQAALEDTAIGAGIFERSASAFDGLGDTLAAIKRHFSEMWAAFATAAAPAIKWALDGLNQISVFARDAAGVIGNAIKAGGLMELIGAGFDALAEQFGHVFFGVMTNKSLWQGVGDAMLSAFSYAFAGMGSMMLSISEGLQAVVGNGLARAFESIQSNPAVRVLLHMAGQKLGVFMDPMGEFKAPTFEETRAAIHKQNAPLHEMFRRAFDLGGDTAGAAAGNFRTAIAEIVAASGGTMTERLKALVDQWKLEPYKDKNNGGGGGGDGGFTPKDYKPSATALEKIGFVFGEGVGPGDYAAQTARNTSIMKDALVKIASRSTNPTDATKLFANV